MDSQRFDDLARGLGTHPNRRGLLAGAAGSVLVLLGFGAVPGASAATGCGRGGCRPTRCGDRTCRSSQRCVDGECERRRGRHGKQGGNGPKDGGNNGGNSSGNQ